MFYKIGNSNFIISYFERKNCISGKWLQMVRSGRHDIQENDTRQNSALQNKICRITSSIISSRKLYWITICVMIPSRLTLARITFSRMTLGRMTFDSITLGWMTLVTTSRMVLTNSYENATHKMPLSKMTHCRMTPSFMTLRRMTHSRMTLWRIMIRRLEFYVLLLCRMSFSQMLWWR